MEKKLKRLEDYREKFESEPAITYADAVNKEQETINITTLAECCTTKTRE